MAYGTGTLTNATPALTFMGILDPLLTTHGYTFIETYQPVAGPTNPTISVYRSPAAGNYFGADWYLLVRRANDTTGALTFGVSEGYTLGTHLATSYAFVQNIIPTAGTYVNPSTANLNTSGAALSYTLPTTLFAYQWSINANRIILDLGSAGGVYAGLYDDLLPAGTTQFPLTVASLIGQVIGGTTNAGMFTREPLQTIANGNNWGAAIYNGQWRIAAVSTTLPLLNFNVVTSVSALYQNYYQLSRVMIGSSRSVGDSGDALRGLLRDCVYSTISSVAGDTIIAGANTYARFVATATTSDVFVDKAA